MGVDSVINRLVAHISHRLSEDSSFIRKRVMSNTRHQQDIAQGRAGSGSPIPSTTSALWAIAATRLSQAALLYEMHLARKMQTALTIVDTQAHQLRLTAGLSLENAYASTASVYAFAGLLLQTNVRTLLAKKRMYEARCAGLIRQNYRMHRARALMKSQRISRCDTWLMRRKSVKGKGSTAEWNDRHNHVKRTMAQAIELFHRLQSGDEVNQEDEVGDGGDVSLGNVLGVGGGGGAGPEDVTGGDRQGAPSPQVSHTHTRAEGGAEPEDITGGDRQGAPSSQVSHTHTRAEVKPSGKAGGSGSARVEFQDTDTATAPLARDRAGSHDSDKLELESDKPRAVDLGDTVIYAGIGDSEDDYTSDPSDYTDSDVAA